MIPLNYHHLYYFWSTVKAGSITRASRNLMLSQPALSLQLRQLEKSLGVPLLRRQRSGVALTAHGRLVFERCERIFSEGEALSREVRRGISEPAALRVGAAQTLSREVVLRLIDSTTLGGARAMVVSSSRFDLRDRLGRHALDIVLSDVDFSTELGPNFRSVLVGKLPLRLVATKEVGKLYDGFLDGGIEAPILLRAPESPMRAAFESLLAARGVRYHVTAETNDANLLRRLALRGHGIAALTLVAVDEDLKAGRLVVIDRGPALMHQPVWLITPRQPSPEPAVQRAVQALMRDFRIR